MVEHKSECIIVVGTVALLLFCQPSSYSNMSFIRSTKSCCTVQKWLRQQPCKWPAAGPPEGIFHEACFVIVQSYCNGGRIS